MLCYAYEDSQACFIYERCRYLLILTAKNATANEL